MEEEEGLKGKIRKGKRKNTGIHNSQHSQSGRDTLSTPKQAFNNHEMPFKKDFSVFIFLADT